MSAPRRTGRAPGLAPTYVARSAAGKAAFIRDLAMHIRAYRDSAFATALPDLSARGAGKPPVGLYPGADRGPGRRWMRARWRQKLADLQSAWWPWSTASRLAFNHRHRDAYRFAVRPPDRAPPGIGGALIEALCVQYPAQILTVDASITAKPCFTAHGFKVVAEQRVAAHGEWFTNYRMENAWR